MFTRPSPSGSPPPPVCWVVFEYGTIFYAGLTGELAADASLDEIRGAAIDALVELGPVVAGGPAGDFSVARLDEWFPDEPVYFVTFDDPRVAAVVIDDVDSELAAGLLGRAAREDDLESQAVVEVRGFDGSRAP